MQSSFLIPDTSFDFTYSSYPSPQHDAEYQMMLAATEDPAEFFGASAKDFSDSPMIQSVDDFGSPIFSDPASSSGCPSMECSPAPGPFDNALALKARKSVCTHAHDSDSESDNDGDVSEADLSDGDVKSLSPLDDFGAKYINTGNAVVRIDEVQSTKQPSAVERREVKRLPRRAARAKKPIKLPEADSDAQSEFDEEGDATEDEFVPSPELKPTKRKRAGRAQRPAPAAPSRPTKRRGSISSQASVASSPGRSTRAPPAKGGIKNWNKRRLAQFREPIAGPKIPWHCPYCPFVQKNERLPDFKRHVRSHLAILEGHSRFRCVGIRCDALQPAEIERLKQQGWVPDKYKNGWFIGGCGVPVSRKDAMSRHLRNSKYGCIGEAIENYCGGLVDGV